MEYNNNLFPDLTKLNTFLDKKHKCKKVCKGLAPCEIDTIYAHYLFITLNVQFNLCARSLVIEHGFVWKLDPASLCYIRIHEVP